MDTMAELGALAFASRLKRLSDRLMHDVNLVYQRLNVDFQPRWFTLFYALTRQDQLSIAEVARLLGLSHTAVIQLAAELGQKGLVDSIRPSTDGRQRLIYLTDKGKETVSRLEPVWERIKQATQELIESTGMDMLAGLFEAEKALDQVDMFRRVWFALPDRPALAVEMASYRPAYKKYFDALNREWLEREFEVEPYDTRLLADPGRYILKKGGQILFAMVEGEVVGTCALICHEGYWELGKMAVAFSMQGLGVGSRLLEAAIEKVKNLGADRLYLQTNARLVQANRLYSKYGFKRVNKHPIDLRQYRRKTYVMRLDLE